MNANGTPSRLRRWLALTAFAAACLVLFLLLLPGFEDGGGDGGYDSLTRHAVTEGLDPVLPRRRARQPAEPPMAPAAAPVPAAAAATTTPTPRHAVLEVEVLTPDGSAAAGASVAVYGMHEWDRQPPTTSTRATGTTDDDGRVDLEVPISKGETAWPGPVIVHAWSSDLAAVGEPLDPWAPEPSAVGRVTVRLRLAEAHTVSGRVVLQSLPRGVPLRSEPKDSPVEGATVQLGGPDSFLLATVTAPDGSFRFPPLPPDRIDSQPALRVTGWSGTFAETSTRLPERGGNYAIEVAPLRTATGRCVSGKGTPVAGVHVLVRGGAQALTDADGRFACSVPLIGGSELVFIPPPPLAPRSLHVAPDVGDDVGTVLLDPGGAIRGTIVVEKGLGIPAGAGWWITCKSDALGMVVRTAQALGEPTFELTGIGPGEHVLRTRWGSHGDNDIAGGEVRGVLPGADDVRLVVRPRGVLRIHPVAATDGEPLTVRSWRVEATGPAPATDVVVASKPDRARDRSGIVMGLPAPGRYGVRLTLPGYAPAEVAEATVGPAMGDVQVLRIALSPADR